MFDLREAVQSHSTYTGYNLFKRAQMQYFAWDRMFFPLYGCLYERLLLVVTLDKSVYLKVKIFFTKWIQQFALNLLQHAVTSHWPCLTFGKWVLFPCEHFLSLKSSNIWRLIITCETMWKDTGSLTDLRAVDSYFKLRTANTVDDNHDNELKPTKVTFQTKPASREKKLYIVVVFLLVLCLGLLIATVVLATRERAVETVERSVCKTQDCLFSAAGKPDRTPYPEY